MGDIAQDLRDWQDYEPVKAFAPEMLPDLERGAHEIERMRAALLNILAKAESGFSFNHANLAIQCRRALGYEQVTRQQEPRHEGEDMCPPVTGKE